LHDHPVLVPPNAAKPPKTGMEVKAGTGIQRKGAKVQRRSAAKAPTKRFEQEQTEPTEEDKARPQKTVHLLSVSSVCSCDNFPAKSFFFASREFNTVL
jgi:hypothetical protein